MKKIFKIVLPLFVILSFWPRDVLAEAKTLGELRQNYNNLVAKQKENENKTEEAKREIAAKEAAIKEAQADIHEAESEMEEAQRAIDESNAKILELTKETESILRYLQQMKGQNAYVEYVSGASTITEMTMRIAAVEQITDHIQDTMRELEAEIKRNEELKVQLAEKKANLEVQIDNYTKVIQERYQDIAEYDEYALDINTQVAVAKKELDMYVKMCNDNLGDTSDGVELLSCTNVPYNGAWKKPLTYGVITSNWGYRTHPVTGIPYTFHNGLDIGGNAEGTPVYAAAAGTVVAKVNRSSCGGNMLYINVVVDNQKYTTYYYHLLSFNVNVGDVVSQDTVIGYVGGGSTARSHGGYDGCTTGAHLHFGVATGWFDSSYGAVRQNSVITPPGFPNQYGWRFTSRLQMYT